MIMDRNETYERLEELRQQRRILQAELDKVEKEEQENIEINKLQAEIDEIKEKIGLLNEK